MADLRTRVGLVQRVITEREQIRRALEVTRLAIRGVARSDLTRMAAALAYRTIFSLVPVLVVGVAVIGSFTSDEELQRQIEQMLELTGLSEIVVNEGAAGGGSEATGPGVDGPADSDGEASPAGPAFARDALDERSSVESWITDLVARVRSVPLSAIGLVGVALLVWAALSMLVELEGAFNSICGATNRRGWTRRVTTYWTVLTLGVLLLLATFRGGQEAGAWVTARLTAVGGPAWVGPIVERTINLAINAGLLMLAYMTVPNASIRFRPALTGGLVAGVLFEIAKGLFTLFLSSGGVERLYGALALLPLFLLWLYVTWVVVLLGLQIAYAMEHFDSWVERFEPGARRPEAVDPAIALAIAAHAARRFADGQTIALTAASTAMGLPANLVMAVLTGLADGGVLVRVSGEEGEETFSLARPAEQVRAADVLATGERLVQSPQAGPEADVVREMAAARRRALGERTLAEIAGVAPPAAPAAQPA